MFVLNINDGYDNVTFTICTNIENKVNNIFFNFSLL